MDGIACNNGLVYTWQKNGKGLEVASRTPKKSRGPKIGVAGKPQNKSRGSLSNASNQINFL